jgi:hypothetical protein
MTLYVLFVRGEVYQVDKSEWELRDTVYKMELESGWEIVRYEPAGTVASHTDSPGPAESITSPDAVIPSPNESEVK